MTLLRSTASEDPEVGTPRKRRARSQLPFMGSEERDDALDVLAHRAFPSVAFFLGALLAAILMAVSVWVQSIPLMIASVLVAPSLAPLAGAALGISTASTRFSVRNLVALVLGGVLVCLGALGVRWFAGAVAGERMLQVALDWPSLLLVAVSSLVLTTSIVRSPEVVRIASAGIWFVLLSGLTVAMWNILDGRWEQTGQALLLTGEFFLLALLVSAITFIALGFRPTSPTILSFRALVVLAIGMGGLIALWVMVGSPLSVSAIAAPTPTMLPSNTPLPTATLQPSQTPLPTATDAPTATPTMTATPTPAPVPAVIRGTMGKGVFLRDAPNGKQLRSLIDGEAVEVLGLPVTVQGVDWIQVRTADGAVGWIVMVYCATATPTVAH
jgi:hypothetical protein